MTTPTKYGKCLTCLIELEIPRDIKICRDCIQKEILKGNKEVIDKQAKKVKLLQKRFIQKYRYNTNNDPIIINKLLRYILRTPEGADVLQQAEKIMSRIIKKDL